MLKQIFTITSFLLPLFSFCLGIYCFFKYQKTKSVILYFFHMMSVVVWGTGLFLGLITKTSELGLLSYQLVYFAAAWIPIIFYHFVSSLLIQYQPKKLFIYSGYFLAVIFSFLVFDTSLIVNGIYFNEQYNYLMNYGSLFYFQLLYFWLYVGAGLYLLIKGYKQSDGINKAKFKYILIGSIIGFGGGATYFLLDLFNIYPWGNLVVFLYPILITYGFFLKKY